MVAMLYLAAQTIELVPVDGLESDEVAWLQ
jgi:hypothetical protein